jgi:glycosyltransferase involved in cell wall biosynthesis
MTLILVLILCVYAATIGQLIYGFGKIKTNHSPEVLPKTFFAIVVPFRNERDNLPLLLESFRNLNYPTHLFEIILVDDFSEDDSVRQVYNWRMENGKFQVTLLENIKLSNSPKKDAIARAIPIIKNDWLVTTDADCIVPENWLLTLDNYIQHHDVSMLFGAVNYDCKKYSFLHHFQQLDLSSLQGATIGSFGMGLGFMCNGANFCYKKSLFSELNGFTGNNKLASGDDVFLLQKAMRKYPQQVHYLKSRAAIVQTKPLDSWKALFHQRVRWASKTGSYQSVFGKDLAVIVFVENLSLVLGFGCCLSSALKGTMMQGWISWLHLVIVFGIKFIVDFVLLYKTNRFLTKKRMRFLILGSLFYPFFATTVALYSLFGKYEWKGRRF